MFSRLFKFVEDDSLNISKNLVKPKCYKMTLMEYIDKNAKPLKHKRLEIHDLVCFSYFGGFGIKYINFYKKDCEFFQHKFEIDRHEQDDNEIVYYGDVINYIYSTKASEEDLKHALDDIKNALEYGTEVAKAKVKKDHRNVKKTYPIGMKVKTESGLYLKVTGHNGYVLELERLTDGKEYKFHSSCVKIYKKVKDK